jgi:V/A-type H+-transporting ATPase subunit I
MFGMMFADAGQGTLLVLLGLMLRAGRPGRLARFRPAWPFLVGAGITAVFFGILFGEFFGPTGVLPVLWIEPLEPILTRVAIGIGACLWPVPTCSAPSTVGAGRLAPGFGLVVGPAR